MTTTVLQTPGRGSPRRRAVSPGALGVVLSLSLVLAAACISTRTAASGLGAMSCRSTSATSSASRKCRTAPADSPTSSSEGPRGLAGGGKGPPAQRQVSPGVAPSGPGRRVPGQPPAQPARHRGPVHAAQRTGRTPSDGAKFLPLSGTSSRSPRGSRSKAGSSSRFRKTLRCFSSTGSRRTPFVCPGRQALTSAAPIRGGTSHRSTACQWRDVQHLV